jgi:hypothetical protein
MQVSKRIREKYSDRIPVSVTVLDVVCERVRSDQFFFFFFFFFFVALFLGDRGESSQERCARH